MFSHTRFSAKNIIALVSVTMAVLLCSPAAAYGTDASELVAVVKETKDIQYQLESAQQEYLASVQSLLSTGSEIDYLTQQIDQTQAEIESYQADLSELMTLEYRSGGFASMLLETLVSNGNISDAIHDYDQMIFLQTYYRELLDKDIELRDRQKEAKARLEELKKEQSADSERLSLLQEYLENQIAENQPRIEELKNQLAGELSELDGAQQAAELLDYLSQIGEMASIQAAIVSAAYTTSYAGSNYCESWAESVYRNAGIDVPRLSSAWASYQSYAKGDGTDDIPIGAWVYGSGSGYMGAQYGHVGIYVGAGMIMDNEASRTHKAVTMSEWIKEQTATNIYTGQTGYFGWGYPDDIELKTMQ